MLANMCVESHLRDLLEQGFEVMVAMDATAGPRHPEWGDGYAAAMVNFRFLAHAVLRTELFSSRACALASMTSPVAPSTVNVTRIGLVGASWSGAWQRVSFKESYSLK